MQSSIKHLLIICIISLSTLSGCTNVSMKPQDRKDIQTLNISEPVKLPASIFYKDLSMSMVEAASAGVAAGVTASNRDMNSGKDTAVVVAAGVAGGMIGEQISRPMGNGPAAKLTNAMIDNNINPGTITKAAIINELENQKKMKNTQSTEADGTLKITINQYGFHHSLMFSNKMYPWLDVTAEIIAKDGRIAWKRNAIINSADPRNTINFYVDEYCEQPERINDAFKSVANSVAIEIVKSIPKQ